MVNCWESLMDMLLVFERARLKGFELVPESDFLLVLEMVLEKQKHLVFQREHWTVPKTGLGKLLQSH